MVLLLINDNGSWWFCSPCWRCSMYVWLWLWPRGDSPIAVRRRRPSAATVCRARPSVRRVLGRSRADALPVFLCGLHIRALFSWTASLSAPQTISNPNTKIDIKQFFYTFLIRTFTNLYENITNTSASHARCLPTQHAFFVNTTLHYWYFKITSLTSDSFSLFIENATFPFTLYCISINLLYHRLRYFSPKWHASRL